jgi:PAS domain-containing protein
MEEQEQVDRSRSDLIEMMHFTEGVSAKVHGLLDEAEIYRTVREEFARSKRYDASVLLLTDDGSKLRVAETSVALSRLQGAEKASGLQVKEYGIDLDKSSVYRQVVRDGRTVQVNVSDIVGELFPGPLPPLVLQALGYGKMPFILAPLERRGKIIGALAVSSIGLAELLIPSVRSLARHISTALELADEYAERSRAEEALKDAEREKQVILDSQLEHVVYQDREHRILWLNRAACESVGTTREELIGRYYHKV